MNRREFTLLMLCFFLVSACTSVEEQQARLEQARAAYREQQLSAHTAEDQQKLTAWQSSLNSVAYAEFYRTEETLGPVVPPVKTVKVTGKELKELVEIMRRGHPVPLPDADILTCPGTEPLKLNDDGEVERELWPPIAPPVLPDSFFAIDRLRFIDAQGKLIGPEIPPFFDIVSRTEAARQRNSWTDRDRPFIMLDDADFQRYRRLPSYRRFVQRMKKAHATGKWDIMPRFDELQ